MSQTAKPSMRLAAWMVALLVTVVAASPVVADEQKDKREARALLKEGVRLLEAKDHHGALEMFESAYAKFPSAKILLNIGTTLKEMGRFVDSANAYQRYLDAPDTDGSRREEVEEILAELDAMVGRLVITTSVAGAELQLGNDVAWIAINGPLRLRVVAGSFVIRGRTGAEVFVELRGDVVAGAEQAVELEIPPPVTEPLVEPPPRVAVGVPAGVAPAIIAEQPRGAARLGRFGGVVNVAIDGGGNGAAVAVGLAVRLGRADAIATGIAGPTFGAYVGASFRVTDGAVRPTVGFGIPMFFSDGIRIGARGAAGVEWAAGSRLGVTAELGVEHFINPGVAVTPTVLVPVVGVRGWL